MDYFTHVVRYHDMGEGLPDMYVGFVLEGGPWQRGPDGHEGGG